MKFNFKTKDDLKKKVFKDYFSDFIYLDDIPYLDFVISDLKNKNNFLLWGDAKADVYDLNTSVINITKFILKIGRYKLYGKHIPPKFIVLFDNEKIIFIPYSDIQDIFYINDFNWNIKLDDYDKKEFEFILNRINIILNKDSLVFYFDKDHDILIEFIKKNFNCFLNNNKIKVDKYNFIFIYQLWIKNVKPSINVNWDLMDKYNIKDVDFYLADLFYNKNTYDLKVKLKDYYYESYRDINELGLLSNRNIYFKDLKEKHKYFWNKYEIPFNDSSFFDYVLNNKNLILVSDIRNVKGAFYTPQIWVELSQKYLKDALGENWQDEYYIWDCAAGTGNLLKGLKNKNNIFASTLDESDINVIYNRIDNNELNLLKENVFQFDFLNDDFDKLPQKLQDIINDNEKRKKLLIYINPPYANSGSGFGKVKSIDYNKNKIKDKYINKIGESANELFVLFLIRIYCELNGCIIGEFSPNKAFGGSTFFKFRQTFKPSFIKGFTVPSYTFDNVKSDFQIGFKIWDTSKTINVNCFDLDVYNEESKHIGIYKIYFLNKDDYAYGFLKKYDNENYFKKIGYLSNYRHVIYDDPGIFIVNRLDVYLGSAGGIGIDYKNLIPLSILYAIRKSIKMNWINSKEHYLFPNDKWEYDYEFQNDCLVITLFDNKNNISYKLGTNHWIPFTEQEVGAKSEFDSHFMINFINGDIDEIEKDNNIINNRSLFTDGVLIKRPKLKFSKEANDVIDAARDVFIYYHKQHNVNVNASLYDIKEYFKGRNEYGYLKHKSEDETFNNLIKKLTEKMNILKNKIVPKIYEYRFLTKNFYEIENK